MPEVLALVGIGNQMRCTAYTTGIPPTQEAYLHHLDALLSQDLSGRAFRGD